MCIGPSPIVSRRRAAHPKKHLRAQKLSGTAACRISGPKNSEALPKDLSKSPWNFIGIGPMVPEEKIPKVARAVQPANRGHSHSPSAEVVANLTATLPPFLSAAKKISMFATA